MFFFFFNIDAVGCFHRFLTSDNISRLSFAVSISWPVTKASLNTSRIGANHTYPRLH